MAEAAAHVQAVQGSEAVAFLADVQLPAVARTATAAVPVAAPMATAVAVLLTALSAAVAEQVVVLLTALSADAAEQVVVLPTERQVAELEQVAILHLSAAISDAGAAAAAPAAFSVPIAEEACAERDSEPGYWGVADSSAAEIRMARFRIPRQSIRTPVAARWAARVPVAFQLTSIRTTRLADHVTS